MSLTSIVWFKRDLRIHDHAPLLAAAERGNVLPLYIVEPELWQQPDASNRHWQFIRESLIELDETLQTLGSRLIVRTGEVCIVFQALRDECGFNALYSHEETGNGWSYERDKAVKRWCIANDITWHEMPQFGVIRPLKTRDAWVRQRDAMMRQPVLPAPDALMSPTVESEPLPGADLLGDRTYDTPQRQPGGRAAAESVLHAFLYERGERYQKEMSSPLTGEHSCSRISPYLAFGCLSMREVWHQAQQRITQLKEQSTGGMWARSMRSFQSRLYWHCHFIQKLEDEPEIEFHNMHRGYDGLREEEFDEARFTAWCEGHTGFPFIDACMRSLHATGWINFRMRAMLVSFASYQLWLHWQRTAWHLAKLFTDYEPGIHYSQIQMQSNTTGINTPRIYNPVKQSHDQDPDGTFIRRWVPELADVPTEWIHEPWKMDDAMRTKYGAEDYPEPIIHLKSATAYARKRLAELRRQDGFYDESKRVMQQHGSRKHRHFPKDQTRQRMEKGAKPRRRSRSDKTQQLDMFEG